MLRCPPVVDGVIVEPIIDEGSRVPTIGYLRNFWALRAHTSPRQVNVEFTIVLAEMVVLWGGLWLVATLTGTDDASPIAPILSPSGGLVVLVNVWGTRFESEALVKQTYLALVSNVAAVLVVILYWLYCFVRTQNRTSSAPGRMWLRNFLYLWVTNVLGFSELVVLNPLAGTPNYHYYASESSFGMMKLLSVSIWLLIGYGFFVALLSPLTFNVAALRILEDAFLVGYAVVQCILLVHNRSHASEGQYLLRGAGGGWQSCVSRA